MIRALRFPVLPRWLFVLMTMLSVWAVMAPSARAEDFLAPEKAFRFAARQIDATQAEVTFRIADGYYLYREQFKFAADGATLGDAQIPPGKVKFDETFGENLETHRGELRIRLPVTAAGAYTLRVTSQGCADAGLCYPPMTSTAQLAPVSAAAPAAEPAGDTPGATGWLDSLRIDQVLRSGRFWQVIGAFFVMGVLLSFTPCVLPMLPILSAVIAGSDGTTSRLRGLALAASYSLGMALVYTALGVAAGLAGEGLAAALQTPWVLGAFGVLLVLLSLSMFDVYELRLPAALQTSLTTTSQRLPAGQFIGVFLMGGLSALIVSPCVSAPLAGALVFISQTRDVSLGGSALFAMAAGMSVPLLLLGASAGTWLPRSGSWMHAVKRFFGLVLLGVALYIVQPVLPGPMGLVGWGLLLLVTAFMLRPFDPHPHSGAPRVWLQRALGVLALVLGALQVVGAAAGAADPLQPLQPLTRAAAARNGGAVAATGPAFRAVRSVAELDDALRTAGRPVMLDFYADWCVSCKEMERFTFPDPAVSALMSRAVLLKADVTANNDDDRALLKRFGLFGPPGTIFFDAQGRELSAVRVVGFQNAERFAQTLRSAGL